MINLTEKILNSMKRTTNRWNNIIYLVFFSVWFQCLHFTYFWRNLLYLFAPQGNILVLLSGSLCIDDLCFWRAQFRYLKVKTKPLQRLVLLPSREKALGSTGQVLSVRSVHFIPMPAWLHTEHCSFLKQSKDMQAVMCSRPPLVAQLLTNAR